MKIGICGMGYVGKALDRFFRRSAENTIFVYDKFTNGLNTHCCKEAVNTAELVFVAVPTGPATDGHCDTSNVEEAVAWIKPPTCIKSTIPPGTVDRLSKLTGKQLAFSPEYIGESQSHPWTEIDAAGILIVGGHQHAANLVIQAYRTSSHVETRVKKTTARAAELCKYMENCFLATKVAFVNQFFDIATTLNVDFNELRSLWLMDSRVGESHTEIREQRGFSGRCLPKDLLALISLMDRKGGGAPFLEGLLVYNQSLLENTLICAPNETLNRKRPDGMKRPRTGAAPQNG